MPRKKHEIPQSPEELATAKKEAGVIPKEKEKERLQEILNEEMAKPMKERDEKLIENLNLEIREIETIKMFQKENVPLPKKEKWKEYTEGTWSIEIDRHPFILELYEDEDDGTPSFIIRDANSPENYSFLQPSCTYYGPQYKEKADTSYFWRILNQPARHSKEYLEILEELKPVILEIVSKIKKEEKEKVD